LHEHLIRGGDRSNVRAWLYRVAHNMARNAQTSHHSSKTDPLPDPGTSAELREESVSPEEQLLQSEAAGRFEQALGGLPVSQRECLILRAQGMKYREIAEATNLSVSTVAEHVQRGLERL